MNTLQRSLAAALLLASLMVGRSLADEAPASEKPSVDKPAADKADPNLVMAFKDADLIFTAKLGKVQPLGQTNSIPASIFGNVSFRDVKPLLGKASAPSYSYVYREGMTQNMDLEAKGEVLVAVKGKGVRAIVPATEANLAIARKVLPAPKEKPKD